MPGAVKTSAAPSVERLRANQLPALPGQISSGTRERPFARGDGRLETLAVPDDGNFHDFARRGARRDQERIAA